MENELNFRLMIAEYDSLRQESAQARDAQQAILRWTLAGIAVVLAGAITSPPDWDVAYLLFGVAIPGFLAGATLAWFGELIRMERVGYYLRGRERTTWPLEHLSEEPATEAELLEQPLAWENFIARGSGTEDRLGLGTAKQWVGYIGTLGLLVGALLGSLGLAIEETIRHDFQGDDFWPSFVFVGIAVLVGVGLFVTYLWIGLGLRRTGAGRADPPRPRLD